jgi:hypothetical protein
VFIIGAQANASPKAPFPKPCYLKPNPNRKPAPLHDPAAQAALFNKGAAANRRPAGQSDGSENLSTIVAADRAFPAAVAGLDLGGIPPFASHDERQERQKTKTRRKL